VRSFQPLRRCTTVTTCRGGIGKAFGAGRVGEARLLCGAAGAGAFGAGVGICGAAITTTVRRTAGCAGLGAGLDWKTSLQELSAGRALGVPEYDVTESGPDHAKAFEATAVVGGRRVGVGQGRSKKEAEQRAAERAWRELSSESGDDEAVVEQHTAS